MTKIQQLQSVLGVVADGKWGPKTQAALDAGYRIDLTAAKRLSTRAYREVTKRERAELRSTAAAVILTPTDKSKNCGGERGVEIIELNFPSFEKENYSKNPFPSAPSTPPDQFLHLQSQVRVMTGSEYMRLYRARLAIGLPGVGTSANRPGRPIGGS